MNKVTTVIVIVIVILAGWFIYSHYSGGSYATETANLGASSAAPTDNGMPAGTTMEDGSVPAATTTGTTTASNVKTFDISAGNYFFTPKTISVNKGDTVQLVVTNSGGFHDLKIDEFNVATPRMNTGDTQTVTFVADKTGTFQYYCSVGDHRAMGMWGTITVN
jgi:plastocyanin